MAKGRPKSWNNEKFEKIKELLAKGFSCREIAKEYKVSEPALRVALARANVSIHTDKHQGHSKLIKARKTKKDIASRIRQLRGEEILENAPQKAISDDLLMEYIKEDGFIQFFKDLINIELQGFQIDIIKKILNHKRVCIVGGRGSSKTFCISLAALYIGITRANQKILIISPAQRQSDILFNYILQFIAQSDELFNSVEKSSAECLKFTNNSLIYPLPSTTYIRGFQQVNFIFCDESAYFLNPDEVFKSIEPMLGLKDSRGEYGSLVIAGSPSGKSGNLWGCWNNPLFIKIKIPTYFNKFISEEWLELQKTQMSTVAYETEIEANFSESIDTFFPYEIIKECSKDYNFLNFPESQKGYFLGCDFGMTRNSSVFTIISKNKDGELRVDNIKELIQARPNIQIETIKLLHKTYNFSNILVENAGLGMPIVAQLQDLRRIEGLSLPLTLFTPTVDKKAEAFNYLLQIMEQKKLTIPLRCEKLQHQLRTFSYEITDSGKLKLHHQNELIGDDFVDSMCFAVNANKIIRCNYSIYGVNAT